MIKFFTILLLAFLSLSSCNKLTPELSKNLTELSVIIKSKEKSKLLKICTERGYKSILSWSDNLRNDTFINNLSENLSNNGQGVFNVSENDSLIYLSLGKSDPIVGATGGYLYLLKLGNEYKIDEFRGGK